MAPDPIGCRSAGIGAPLAAPDLAVTRGVGRGAGTRAGHQYNLLGHVGSNASGVIVEPYLIELTTESDTFATFQHDGIEFIYMLQGEVDYHHAGEVYNLEPGDSFTFDADAPHGPGRLKKLPARYLSIITYPQ